MNELRNEVFIMMMVGVGRQNNFMVVHIKKASSPTAVLASLFDHHDEESASCWFVSDERI